LSYGGTFTLERILGTIPVEPDGSAYADVPALRSLLFIALDENDLSVKRMQSFCTLLPGETTTCVGCGPVFSISYYTMTARNLAVDGRNGLGNRPPRSTGNSASRLLKLADGSHYGAKPSELDRKTLRLRIDSGAVYAGTYAALGTGMVGAFDAGLLAR
jgi:hypothetical protein